MPGDPEPTEKAETPPSWWSRYWFPVMSPARLAVMRIAMPAYYLVFHMDPLAKHLARAAPPDGFNQPQGLVYLLLYVFPAEWLRGATVLTVFWWVNLVAGVLTMLGVFTRVSLAVFAVGVWGLVSHEFSYGDYHHSESIFTMLLLLMMFVPCGRALSADSWWARRRGARPGVWGLGVRRTDVFWPLLVTQWLVALMYLNAGLAKLQGGGLHWLNGYTLQTYLLRDGLRRQRPLGLWLSEHHTLCQLMSFGALGFELTFIVCMFLRRLAPLYVLGGVAMHLGIYVVQGARFWPVLVLYLCWVPWERWLRGQGSEGGATLSPP